MTTPKAISANSRLFIIPYTAGPGHNFEYQGTWRAQGLTEPAGDSTRVEEPDPYEYGRFNTVAVIVGAPALYTTTLEARMAYQLSRMKYLKDLGCPLDIHINLGQCTRPDLLYDADLQFILEQAHIDSWNTTDLGAIEGSQNAPINETIPVSYVQGLQIKKLAMTEVDSVGVTREIVSINLCDRVNCGTCGNESNGCSTVFAVSVSAGGSPGLPADVLYSTDGGQTWGKTNIDSLSVSISPTGAACAGNNYVVAAQAALAIEYAPQADILSGADVWTENAAGIVAAHGPNAVFALAASQIWAAAQGGYIYHWTDVTATATVQTSGGATVQNLTAIHGSDASNLVAVGASNAVLFTQDGGGTWSSVTGPAVGVALNTVFVRSQTTWEIGAADGSLYYTNDSGATWSETAFPGSGSGTVDVVTFVQSASQSIGYMAHTTAAGAGRIFRSLDGGQTWTLQPQIGTTVAFDSINAIATCWDPNVFYAGGLADNATDGIIVKAA